MSRSGVLIESGSASEAHVSQTRRILASQGPGAAARHVAGKLQQIVAQSALIPLGERFYNRRFGLALDQRQETAFSRAAGSECVRYEATPWVSFQRAMRELHLRPEGEVFVDFGCGMGKVLTMAALHPFSRVVGVEVCPELSREAQGTIERLRGRLRCEDVEVVNSDAAAFDPPGDMTVAFFFNPFTGSLLERVCRKLEAAARAAAHPIRIVYANPQHFERAVEGASWLRKVAEFDHRTRWALFETLPGAAPSAAADPDAVAA